MGFDFDFEVGQVAGSDVAVFDLGSFGEAFGWGPAADDVADAVEAVACQAWAEALVVFGD